MKKKYKLNVITPIYKANFNEIECYSISHSLRELKEVEHTFFFPIGLDLDFYTRKFKKSKFLAIPKEFFISHKSYNQLCYEVEFYKLFINYSHILILQPDAIITNAKKLEMWCNSDYDYIGGPESNLYSYDIRGIPPFDILKESLQPIKLQGLNGGLSLRRVEKIISVLEEYPHLTKFFRTYAGGIGEDIFFSLLSKVTQQEFKLPNEITASKFAITCKFKEWLAFNNYEMPLGFHAWYQNTDDKDFIMNLIRKNTHENT